MTNCRGLVLFRISGLNESSWSGRVGILEYPKFWDKQAVRFQHFLKLQQKPFQFPWLQACVITLKTGMKLQQLAYKLLSLQAKTSTLFCQKMKFQLEIDSNRILPSAFLQLPELHCCPKTEQ